LSCSPIILITLRQLLETISLNRKCLGRIFRRRIHKIWAKTAKVLL
jgi:hypothetical protein